MITPYMTDEELKDAAHRDFLEMRVKVKIAFEQFVSNLRLGDGQYRVIHSVIQNKTITTKSKNTWNVIFINFGYNPREQIIAGYLVYTPLYREGAVDYLFINNTDQFVLEKLSAHFLQRYKERYLEYNGINLRGQHPALYYMINNQDKTLTYYLPEHWTEQEMKEKRFMLSQQGLSLVRFSKNMITYITFLDQENLSRYKAMVYEEEALMKDMTRINNKLTFDNKQALFKKLCADPSKTKAILARYIRRISDIATEEDIDIVMNYWDEIVKQTQNISEMKEKHDAETARTIELPDMEYFFKKMKKGKQ